MTKPSVLFLALSAALAVTTAHATTPQDELAAKQRAAAEEAAGLQPARAGIRTKDIEVASDTTVGAPTWNRPLSNFGSLSGTGTNVPYVAHPFIVSANDNCSIALDSLAADHDFLLKGDVFSKDQIEAYIELKWEEVTRWETTPSPVEFDMYYSA